jgi:hypothetical protein
LIQSAASSGFLNPTIERNEDTYPQAHKERHNDKGKWGRAVENSADCPYDVGSDAQTSPGEKRQMQSPRFIHARGPDVRKPHFPEAASRGHAASEMSGRQFRFLKDTSRPKSQAGIRLLAKVSPDR